MLNKKEMFSLIAVVILMGLILAFNPTTIKFENIASFLLISIIIIGIFVISKKLIARHLDMSVDFKIWELSRYWITKKSHLKNPLPMGFIIPIIFTFLSSGYVKALTFLQYKTTALPSKAVKKYGLRRFSTITEFDESLLVFYALTPLLAISIISSFITGNFFSELSKISLYYVCWNLIPFSKLEGMKLLMGSKPLYISTTILTAITALIVLI